MKNCRLLISIIVLTLLICPYTSFAEDSLEQERPVNINKDSAISLLVSKGYSYDTATALDESDIKELYFDILSGKDVTVSSCTLEVDNFKAIEDILKYDESELIEAGLSEENVRIARNEIQRLFSMSDRNLQNELGLSGSEVKILRDIQNKATSNILDERKVITSPVEATGGISTAKMSYSMAVTDNSTSTKPNYKVKCTFNWKKVFIVGAWNDYIAVAWGGGMNSKSESGTVNYYKVADSGWGSKYESKSMSKTAVPNKGFKFYFGKSYYYSGNKAVKSKSGTANITVYQTKKKGLDTKIISQYGHRTVTTGSSISISNTPTISFGAGYDKSDQKSKNVTY